MNSSWLIIMTLLGPIVGHSSVHELAPQDPHSENEIAAQTTLQEWWKKLEPNRFAMRPWFHQDGLPQNSVICITQTRDGYLWFGTFGGLARFNGVNFEIFDPNNTPQLRSTRILSLFEDSTGALWVGTTLSFTRFKDGRFADAPDIADPESRPPEDFLSLHRYTAFAETPDGAIWIASWKGLFRFKEGRFDHYSEADGLPTRLVQTLATTADGALWIGTNKGLAVYRDERIEAFPNLPVVSQRSISAMHIDEENSLWLGGNAWVARLINEKVVFTRGAEHGLEGAIRQFVRLDENRLILAGQQLWYLDRRTLNIAEAEQVPKLPFPIPTRYRSAYLDREDNLWLGTDTFGVVQFRRTNYLNFGESQGLTVGTPQVIASDGSDGLVVRDGGGRVARIPGTRSKTENFTVPPSFGNSWNAHSVPDGSLFIYNRDAISYRKDGRWTSLEWNAEQDGRVKSVHLDEQGRLWILTAAGLWLRREGHEDTFHAFPISLKPVGNARIHTHDADGHLWLSTSDQVLHFRDGVFESFTHEDGLAYGQIRSIHVDEDRHVWITSYGGGLCRIKDGSLFTFSTQNGLPDNSLSRLLEDNTGHFWINSNRGMLRVSRHDLNAFADGLQDDYNCHRLLTGEANGGMGFKSTDGKLWFPVFQGVVGIDPSAYESNEIPPLIQVNTLDVDGISYPVGSSVDITPGRRDLTIRYDGLSFVDPELVQFRYQLIGYDEDWLRAGTNRKVHYTNLPPGPYEFRVMAQNSHGVWSDPVPGMTLVFKPYFHETRLFQASVVFGLLILFGFGWRLRIRGLHRHYEAVRFESIERKEAEATLTNVARGYSTSTDELFFKSLASHLALELDAEYTIIGELCPDDSERISTIAVFADGELLENFQYDLKGTPCENVTQQNQCVYKCGIQDKFPEDQLLVDMGVEAYVGTPLNDTNGNAIGLMAVLFRHELEDTRKAETILRIYAVRAQAELERMRTEVEIQEKEKQLDNLLSNVGVIVLEGDPFNIYYVGGQFERILGYPKELWFEDPDGPVGFWSKHLHPDDTDKLEICRQAIELGEDHSFEYRMIAADGREVWFYDTVTVETENGVPVKTRSVMVDITDRKQAEDELRENEGRTRALLEGAFEGIVISESGKILEANHAFADMYGYAMEEVIGLSPVELTSPEAAQEITHRIATGDEEPYEIVGLKKDGTSFDLEILGKNCIYRGRVARIAAVRDITDKKRLEKASLDRIHRAERQQATLTELVTNPSLIGGDLKEAATVITQLAGKAIDVERTSVWLLSNDRKSILCEKLFELTPNRHSHGLALREDDYPSYFQALKTSRVIVASDAVADPRTCEFVDSYLNPLGISSMLDVAVRVSGEIVGVVCHEHVGELRDWTPDEIAFAGQIADQVALVLSNQERRRAKRELHESEEQVRLLLDSTAEAIYGLDLDGNCTFCNPACLEMLGYDSPDHLMGKNMHELIHHTRNDGSHYPIAECLIYETIREGRGTHVDDEVLWKQNGESFDAEYWSFPIRREGQIVGSVVTFLDITERKLTQDRQKLLMAELDHRVKNNLAAVIALAEQTLATTPSMEAFRESYIGRIQALTRIHETLAATKWTGAKLHEILRLTLDPYSRENNQRISTRGDDIILEARCCQPITMAMHELATNAAKYGSLSTPAGTISIEWRLDPDQQLHLSWTEFGGPPIADPPHQGFGSSLIRGVIEHELSGTVGIEYLKDGLSCTMIIPMKPHPPQADLLESSITRNVKEHVLP